jgi:hypothetical protein
VKNVLTLEAFKSPRLPDLHGQGILSREQLVAGLGSSSQLVNETPR